jgi:hypothetical protein
LSLVFGGLLWPIAWLWAYSKPVVHKMAYGTDKASHDVDEEGNAWDTDGGPHDAKPVAVLGLHDRLAQIEARLSAEDLKTVRSDIEAIEAKLAGIK